MTFQDIVASILPDEADGCGAVIDLAPPTVDDAAKDEALFVGRLGLTFVAIPIPFDKPTDRDCEAFADVVKAMASRRVLVHCRIDSRASSMTFPYRAIANRENPDRTCEAVARAGPPDGTWKAFIRPELRMNGIAFEPY